MGLLALLHEPAPERGPHDPPVVPKLSTVRCVLAAALIALLAGAIGLAGGDSDRPQTGRQVCESRWMENAHRFDPGEQDAYIDTCMETNDDLDAIVGR